MAHFEKYKASALGNMTDHYARVPERERGYVRANIDNSRTWRNYNLAPARGMSQVEYVNKRIASLKLKRLRKDAVRMCDCVVTLPRNAALEGREREFFQAVYDTLAKTFGEENVVSAWVHRDETQPHMHFAWVPVTADGRLSAKDVLSRPFLKGFHGALEGAVSERLGIDRAGLRLTEEERDARGGKYVGLEEYKDAKADAARAAQRAAESERAAEFARDAQRAAEDATAAQRADLARLREETRAERERLEGLQQAKKSAEGEIEELERGIAEAVERRGSGIGVGRAGAVALARESAGVAARLDSECQAAVGRSWKGEGIPAGSASRDRSESAGTRAKQARAAIDALRERFNRCREVFVGLARKVMSWGIFSPANRPLAEEVAPKHKAPRLADVLAQAQRAADSWNRERAQERPSRRWSR